MKGYISVHVAHKHSVTLVICLKRSKCLFHAICFFAGVKSLEETIRSKKKEI